MAVHPQWTNCVSWSLAPAYRSGDLEKWINDHVFYVCARSFANLDLSDGAHCRPCEQRTQQYDIWFHIGEEKPCSKSRGVREAKPEWKGKGNPEMSISDVIWGLIDWHKAAWPSGETPMTLDAIVRTTVLWTEKDEIGKRSVEIYPVPESFHKAFPRGYLGSINSGRKILLKEEIVRGGGREAIYRGIDGYFIETPANVAAHAVQLNNRDLYAVRRQDFYLLAP